MRRHTLCSVFCLAIGFPLGALGALALLAQYLEWQSFGNWNAVSLRYVSAYFEVQLPPFISPASLIWDFPISAVLMGAGGSIAIIGMYCLQKSSRTGHVMHSSQR